MRTCSPAWRALCVLVMLTLAAGAGTTGTASAGTKKKFQFKEIITVVPKMKPARRPLPARLGQETFALTYLGKGVLAYRFDVTVANHCYSKGPVKATKELFGTGLEASLLEITADIGWQAGICAQAAKQLSYRGRLKTRLSGNVDVVIKMRDRRSGRISTHQQQIRITEK